MTERAAPRPADDESRPANDESRCAGDAVAPTRVRRPRSAAAAWYGRLGRWYGRLAGPFEAPAREAGLALLDARPGERVVDVGSGPGTALVPLARSVGPEGWVVGVDVAAGMCRAARDHVRAAAVADRVAVVRGDAEHLPLGDASVDAAFASFTLELFDTPAIPRVLAEWGRVLGPDGRLVVVALSRARGGLAVRAYERLHGWFPTALDCRPIHVGRALRSAGFEVVERRDRTMWGLPVAVVLAEPTG